MPLQILEKMLQKILFLILGGSIGTSLRYLITIGTARFAINGFPVGTFIVNLLGSFFIGLSFAYFERVPLSDAWRLFLFVGIFGSFTTFSTFIFEGYYMLKLGAIKTAFLYLLSSNVLGLSLFFLGVYLVSSIK